MRERWFDVLWLVVCGVASSLWCVTAAQQIGPTFDEPVYIQRGLQGWRDFSHQGLLKLGTMPLPIDVQTLPLFLWETWSGQPLDTVAELHDALPVARAGNLVFWVVLLVYTLRIGRSLAGPWGGRLALALAASEPNLLAHASLATTDIALAACLLAFAFHFSTRRYDASWWRRWGLPGVCLGFALTAKASALVYGPICMAVIETHRLLSARAWVCPQGTPWRQRLRQYWNVTANGRRDALRTGLVGFALAMVYCGCDWQAQPDFVRWTERLPDGALANALRWSAAHLCLFSNGAEGIVRQIKHNMRGHGTYLLGTGSARALWYYFPVLLTIKLTLPLLLLPLGTALSGHARRLLNWAFLLTLTLVLFSITFRVQLGIRMVLPLVALGLVGLAAAGVEGLRSYRARWQTLVGVAVVTAVVMWQTAVAASVWPHGLCHVNPLWGGTQAGYFQVSDSNYDWGQGLPELGQWCRQHPDDNLDVWYFGTDPAVSRLQARQVHFHACAIASQQDVVQHIQGRYLAVSITLLWGAPIANQAHTTTVAFLRQCQPIAKTSTFVIFERQALIDNLAAH